MTRRDSMAKTFFLIDGHSLVFQSYYAIPGLTAPDGRPTGAVYGFIRALDRILREGAPDLLAVVFDAHAPSFRHKRYPPYKANRSPMPEDLVPQVPLIREIVSTRQLPTLAVEGVEADDVIATLAVKGREAGFEVRIVSRDKDLRQLLGDGVKMVDGKSGDEYGLEEFTAEFGIAPERFPDVQGLAGDSVDNIPGVPGIGMKKGTALVKAFGSLEDVLKNWEQVRGPKTSKSVRDHADQARLSYELAKLRTDVPLPLSLSDLDVPESEGDTAEIYRELGFHSLVEVKSESAEDRDYRIADRSSIKDLLAELDKAPRFAFDVETTSTDALESELVGLSFATSPGTGWYVPLRAPDAARCLDEAAALEAFAPVLGDPSKEMVGHNLKFDLTVLRRRGVSAGGNVFDTLVAAYLLDPGRRSLSLDAQAQEVLNLKTVPISDLIGKGKDQTTLDTVDLDRVGAYACEDADVALRLGDALAPRLEADGLTHVFADIEMPLVPILTAMECDGIGLDTELLQDLDDEVDGRAAALEAEVHRMAGEAFNLNSPKQLQVILFEKLGLPVVKKTKTGPSTDADVLERLASHHPLPAMLAEFRALKKLQSTYIRALPRCVRAFSGRVHASFNQAVVATGRLSSSAPNLQNIPTRTEMGARIREAFVAGPGKVFLTADYSQVELRIMAHLSGDEELIRAFAEGQDIHAAVAAEIHDIDPGLVTKEMRQVAKAVNFGILYGQTPFGLARELGLPQREAARFIDAFFRRYAGVKTFTQSVIEKAREEGRVRTLSGRLRKLPELQASNKQRRMLGERTAINTVIQGSAADLIKLAMIRVDRRLRDEDIAADMLVQIHDELLFEVDADALDTARAAVVSEMEGALSLKVPVKVDWTTGANWKQL